MKTTSFGFIDLAESFVKDALSTPPLGGGSWGFQRSVNFSERSGMLQIILKDSSGVAKTKASIQARQTGTAKDYSIQGWTEFPDQDKRTMFVLKESNPVRAEEEIFEIVDRLLAEIPERDNAFAVERPAPAPKSSFAPLIPEIQSTTPAADASPAADAFDSSQSFIDSLLAANDETAPEAAPAPEPADSNQALVDSLLSPANQDETPAAAEEPASEVPSETPAEEVPSSEETAPKAKTAKSKKTTK